MESRFNRQYIGLFDHLIGDGKQTWRHLDVQRSRRLNVDYEFESGRLQRRQVGVATQSPALPAALVPRLATPPRRQAA
jgi:hypothetical protein